MSNINDRGVIDFTVVEDDKYVLNVERKSEENTLFVVLQRYFCIFKRKQENKCECWLQVITIYNNLEYSEKGYCNYGNKL